MCDPPCESGLMRTAIIAAEGEEPRARYYHRIESAFSHRNRVFPSDGESTSPVNFAAADEEVALSPEDRQLACLVWDG